MRDKWWMFFRVERHYSRLTKTVKVIQLADPTHGKSATGPRLFDTSSSTFLSMGRIATRNSLYTCLVSLP